MMRMRMRRSGPRLALRNKGMISNFQCSPVEIPEGLNIQLIKDTGLGYEVSTLDSGVRIVTERQPFPCMVDLGVLVGVGTRDETLQESGSLLSIK
jgi:hypothetical protein